MDAVDLLIDIFEEHLNDETYTIDMSMAKPQFQELRSTGYLINNILFTKEDVVKFNRFLVGQGLDIVSGISVYTNDMAAACITPLTGKIKLENLTKSYGIIPLHPSAICEIDFSRIKTFMQFDHLLRMITKGSNYNVLKTTFETTCSGMFVCKNITKADFIDLCITSSEKMCHVLPADRARITTAMEQLLHSTNQVMFPDEVV